MERYRQEVDYRRRAIAGVSALAIAVSSAACSASSSSEATAPVSVARATETGSSRSIEASLTYGDVADAIADGPVWVGPWAAVGEETTAIRPFVANDGDVSCSTPGEFSAVADGEAYVVGSNGQLVEVDLDGTAIVARREGVTEDTVSCVEFEPLIDSYDGKTPGFSLGQIPQMMLINGQWYRVATEVSSGGDPSTLLDAVSLNPQ